MSDPVARLTDDQQLVIMRLAGETSSGGDGATRFILVQNSFEELRERVDN